MSGGGGPRGGGGFGRSTATGAGAAQGGGLGRSTATGAGAAQGGGGVRSTATGAGAGAAQGGGGVLLVNASGAQQQLQGVLATLQQIQALSTINLQVNPPPGGVEGALGAQGMSPAPGFAPSTSPSSGGSSDTTTGAGAAQGTSSAGTQGSAPYQPPQPYPSDLLTSRLITASGGVLATGAQMAGQGAYNAGAGANLFGAGFGGIASAIGRGITNLGAVGGLPMLGPVGALVGGLGAGVGAWADLLGQGINLRLENLRRIGGLERYDIQSRALGGPGAGFDSAALGAGASAGLAPEEAAGLLTSYRRQLGAAGAAPLPFGALLAGQDPGVQASYLGQRAAGYGGASVEDTSRNLGRLLGTAQDGGLRGSKVDEYLSRLVALNQQAAERGIKVDLSDQAGFLEALRTRGLEGRRGVQVAESLQGTASSGLEQMRAPLRQIATQMQIATAFDGATSYEGGLRRLGEASASPNLALQGLGQDAELRRLLLAGVAGPDTLGLAGERGTLYEEARDGTGGARGGRISSTLARQDLAKMRLAFGGGGADVDKFLDATFQGQASLIGAATGESAERLVGLGNGILEGMAKLTKTLDSLIRTVEAQGDKRIYAPVLEDDRVPSPFDLGSSGPKF